MSTAATSYVSPHFPHWYHMYTPRTASVEITQKSNKAYQPNKTGETVQKKTDEAVQKVALSATPPSTALTLPRQVRRFKDNTASFFYELFYKSLDESLTHKSQTANGHSYNFPPELLVLIGEYEDELITFPLSLPHPLRREFVSTIGFGEKMWKNYFGNIGKVPSLPNNIGAILKSKCPFFEGKTVQETHMLTLIPATLNGTSMTLERLGELMRDLDLKQGKTGYMVPAYNEKANYTYCSEHAYTPFEASHWVLMTNNVPEETRNEIYKVQKEFVAQHPNYHVPKLSEAAVAIFAEYVTTGIYRFGRKPWTYTRCQEDRSRHYPNIVDKMIVGGYIPDGLCIDSGPDDACGMAYDWRSSPNYGIAPLLKFF